MTRLSAVAFVVFTACSSASSAPPTHRTTTSSTTASTTTAPSTTTTAPAAVVSPPRSRVGESSAGRGAAVATPGEGDVLACLRRHESGGNYTARNGHGHTGAYQFDRSTWASVGGTGEAADASPEEQDARAAELLRQRGLQPWSVRERCR